MLAGALAAAFPDSDFVLSFLSPIVYLEAHRGATHSLLLWPLWTWLLAWIVARLARDPAGWRAWYGVCALGIGAHIAGDLITGFGTMIFTPLSRARIGIGTTFIIDLWFSGIIVLGLLASALRPRSRAPAVAASLALVGYVGVQWVLKQEAIDWGVAQAHARGLQAPVVTAHPRPVSPFNWTVFAAHGDVVDYAHVNLRRTATPPLAADAGLFARLDAAYAPLAEAQWHRRTRFGDTASDQAVATDAWASDPLAFFRRFAEIPVFDGLTAGPCVWFRDLRFETPGRGVIPFRYGVCRHRATEWALFQRDDASQ